MVLATILLAIGMFVSLAAAFKKGKKMHIILGVLYIVSSEQTLHTAIAFKFCLKF